MHRSTGTTHSPWAPCTVAALGLAQEAGKALGLLCPPVGGVGTRDTSGGVGGLPQQRGRGSVGFPSLGEGVIVLGYRLGSPVSRAWAEVGPGVPGHRTLHLCPSPNQGAPEQGASEPPRVLVPAGDSGWGFAGHRTLVHTHSGPCPQSAPTAGLRAFPAHPLEPSQAPPGEG